MLIRRIWSKQKIAVILNYICHRQAVTCSEKRHSIFQLIFFLRLVMIHFGLNYVL